MQSSKINYANAVCSIPFNPILFHLFVLLIGLLIFHLPHSHAAQTVLNGELMDTATSHEASAPASHGSAMATIVAGGISSSNKVYTITAIGDFSGEVEPVAPAKGKYPLNRTDVNTAEVNSGSDITYRIIPIPGYSVVDVMIDGVPVGPKSSYTFRNLAANHLIMAIFAEKSYTTACLQEDVPQKASANGRQMTARR